MTKCQYGKKKMGLVRRNRDQSGRVVRENLHRKRVQRKRNGHANMGGVLTDIAKRNRQVQENLPKKRVQKESIDDPEEWMELAVARGLALQMKDLKVGRYYDIIVGQDIYSKKSTKLKIIKNDFFTAETNDDWSFDGVHGDGKDDFAVVGSGGDFSIETKYLNKMPIMGW